MDYISLCKLAHLLALRSDPELAEYDDETWMNIKDDEYICLICNQCITDFSNWVGKYPSVFEKHIIRHLKENNLLPFT